jgi:hypothetical protein
LKRHLPYILFLFLSLSILEIRGQNHAMSGKTLDTLPVKIDSLQAVIVRAKLLPRLKGDTVEYKTDNIRLNANANVEELLGRLPGLQIDANGNITYNGEKISRLLVDGEDLFGSDPTLVTRNFNADMIAWVQVLNEKSDIARFTGIDDGKRNKTLNLVLNESAKHGYFGKTDVGGDVQGTYDANGLFGDFRGKRQLTALGFASNTGVQGFAGAAGEPQGELYIWNSTNDPLGASAGPGIPQVVMGGLHYANTWNGKEDHLVGNYEYGHLSTRPFTATISEQTLTNGSYMQNQSSSSLNAQDQHTFYENYDYLPDSLNSLSLVVNGMRMQGRNQFSSTGSSALSDTLVNTGLDGIKSDVTDQSFGSVILWKLRARKNAGRTFSVVSNFSRIDNTTNGYLYSVNRFFQPDGNVLNVDTADQRKQIVSHDLIFGGSASYTEPIGKNASLGLQYGMILKDNESVVGTYANDDGKYTDFIDSLSSHSKSIVLNQNILFNLQGKSTHFNYTLGGNFHSYDFQQKDLLTDSTVGYRHIDVMPMVLTNYSFDPSSKISFSYKYTIQQPSIGEMQPVENNTDPLHIWLGNTGLKPSYSQNFDIGISQLRPSVVHLSMNFTLTGNTITTKTYTDSLGRQVTQPINAGGSKNIGLSFLIDMKLTPLDIDAALFTKLNYDRSINYIDTNLSRNDIYTSNAGFRLTKYVNNLYSIQLRANFTYFYNQSSINSNLKTEYWTQDHLIQLSLFPVHDLELSTNAHYTWQEKTNLFGKNVSILTWNEAIIRHFSKNRLALRFSINNLLNQHSGITRTSLGNSNTQATTNVSGRYWLLSLSYRFKQQRRPG